MAWARPISPPSVVTTELLGMFWALNGATETPRRARCLQIPATSALLPASDVVPATRSAPRTAAPYVGESRLSTRPVPDSDTASPGFRHGESRLSPGRGSALATRVAALEARVAAFATAGYRLPRRRRTGSHDAGRGSRDAGRGSRGAGHGFRDGGVPAPTTAGYRL